MTIDTCIMITALKVDREHRRSAVFDFHSTTFSINIFDRMFCFDTCGLIFQDAGEPFRTFESVVSFYVKAVKHRLKVLTM